MIEHFVSSRFLSEATNQRWSRFLHEATGPVRLQELQDIVRATKEFQKAVLTGHLLRLPTGDGMALSFFGDPEAPVRCAVEIGRALRTHPHLKLRMGIHSGLVYRIADINENLNISGGGINIAQRVMDCGDAGHILLSKRLADDLRQLSGWVKQLHNLGEVEVKHRHRVHVYNFYDGEIGNTEIPAKLRPSIAKALPIKPIIAALAILLVVLVGVILVKKSKWLLTPEKSKNQGIGSAALPVVPSRRSFTYFLTPWDKTLLSSEERYAGNELFRNGSTLTFVLIPEQEGALYLINQGRGSDGRTVLNVLFPTPENNNGSSVVTANQRLGVPIRFDPYPGDELVLIIWTTKPVPELDAIFKDAAKTDWEIKNSTNIVTVKDFLHKHELPAPKVETDYQKKETRVTGNNETLISTRILKHDHF